MMNIVDHVTLTNSVRIAANPGTVWRFFDHLEQNYKAWHPQDHISCRWTKGRPHQVGSVVEAVELIAGKARKVRMTCTAVQENRRIEYQTMFPLSLFHPSSTYLITETGPKSVEFTALDRFRVPVLLRRIVAPLIAATDRHIKEEGQNLKRLLEEATSLIETPAPVPCIQASASGSRQPPSEA
jgi:hypothetical protein